MYSRLFSTNINPAKFNLETSTEWVSLLPAKLQHTITALLVDSFLEVYRDYSEKQIGLTQPGITKKAWLTKMIRDELEDIKKGKLCLATISIQDTVVGFITCTPITSKLNGFKNEVYISSLAIKPFYDAKSGRKMRIGLGQRLIECVMSRFSDANTFTLDTQISNHAAKAFYEKLGFIPTDRHVYSINNPDHLTGYAKKVIRRI